jgi:hypothetical protein
VSAEARLPKPEIPVFSVGNPGLLRQPGGLEGRFGVDVGSKAACPAAPELDHVGESSLGGDAAGLAASAKVTVRNHSVTKIPNVRELEHGIGKNLPDLWKNLRTP